MKSYTLDGNSLTIPQISAIAADFTEVKLNAASKRAIRASRRFITIGSSMANPSTV